MAISELKAIKFASRMVAGDGDPILLQWFRSGLSAWMRDEGGMPMECYLGLHLTPAKRLNLKRNEWINAAAMLVDARSAWGRACELSEQLDIFLSRGPWLAWSDLSQPPPDASNLRAALFHIAKTNHGKPLGAKRIHDIFKHIST